MFHTTEGKPGVRKLIIDTDPGVDDTWAICLALRSPEVEVIGITSLFGNVRTKMATQNALYLMEKFGRPDIPVVEGSLTSIVGAEKERIARMKPGEDKAAAEALHNQKLREAISLSPPLPFRSTFLYGAAAP